MITKQLKVLIKREQTSEVLDTRKTSDEFEFLHGGIAKNKV